MGTQRRMKRKFNKAGGKQSFQYRKVTQEGKSRKGTRSCHNVSDNKKTAPYQLIHKVSSIDGFASTKFIVRRIAPSTFMKKSLHVDESKMKLLIKSGFTNLDGYRIINLDNLKNHVMDITMHSIFCEKAKKMAECGIHPIKIVTESRRNGLASVLWAFCNGCKEKFPLDTSKRDNESVEYDINVRAVWGTMTSGGGASNLNETLATLCVPTISDRAFSRLELKIGQWWKTILEEEMLKAGMEERRLAIERDDFHEGIPAITVVCDGGWSKRTHKHSYNALGGVGVIFGAETKKLLHLGVRNRHCYICSKAENEGVDPSNHECFKNWNDSAQSMESDIIVEGFLKAENTHGLRYMRLIADGDSSVYSNIQEQVPIWGAHVKKIECANHVCKCLRVNLEKLVAENPHYKGRGKLSKRNIIRLTTAVRCAIKMRSKDKNVKQLEKDIRNSIHHVLGFHDKCSDFCKNKKQVTTESSTSEMDSNNAIDDVDEIIISQSQYWTFGNETEARSATTPSGDDVTGIIRDVTVFLNRIADKSNRLIGNFTTNLAESWMSIRCKFDGGKMVNRCNRGSWHARCYGGALRKNLGAAWSPQVFQRATGMRPGYIFCNAFRQRASHLRKSLKSQGKESVRARKRQRKLNIKTVDCSKKAKRSYGESVLDDTPDVAEEKLSQVCNAFMKQHIIKDDESVKVIEKETRGQVTSEVWHQERKCRLTSSNFGKVVNRKDSNTSTNLVKNLLYSNFKGNLHTIRGLAQS